MYQISKTNIILDSHSSQQKECFSQEKLSKQRYNFPYGFFFWVNESFIMFQLETIWFQSEVQTNIVGLLSIIWGKTEIENQCFFAQLGKWEPESHSNWWIYVRKFLNISLDLPHTLPLLKQIANYRFDADTAWHRHISTWEGRVERDQVERAIVNNKVVPIGAKH